MRRLMCAIGILMLFGAAAVAWAAAPDAAAIARAGNGRVPACNTCHGRDGGGMAAAGFPRLAGLNADYLLRQLDDYANGSRANVVMVPTAQGLSAVERRALADYFSRLPIPAQAPLPAPTDAAGLGEWLATRGRWSAQVPGCVQCHGPHGVGVGAHFPPLAGQPAAYTAAQLRAWQQGQRRNDPLAMMQHVANALDAQDITAVAAWFAAQPATIEGAKP